MTTKNQDSEKKPIYWLYRQDYGGVRTELLIESDQFEIIKELLQAAGYTFEFQR